MKKVFAVLAVLLALGCLAIPAMAHVSDSSVVLPLTGQYKIEVETESLGGDSWVFRYIITNLTEEGYYSDIGGLPVWCNGIDYTGLDGFFIRVPHGATISNVQVPAVFTPPQDAGNYWSYDGPRPDDDTYDWISIWGNGAYSIYPKGYSLTFSFQIDNVQVGTNEARLTTYYLDHWMRYGMGEPDKLFSCYTTQIISPVPIGPPQQQIDNIQDVFDASVASETLLGNGPTATSSNGKLKALRNMLERAEYLVDSGLITEACQQLQDAYKKTDDNPKPPDLVTGDAAATLATQIQNLINSLGCP